MSAKAISGILMEALPESDEPVVVIKEKRIDPGQERIGTLVELAYLRALALNQRDDIRALCEHHGIERNVVSSAQPPQEVRQRAAGRIHADPDCTLAEIAKHVITERLRHFHGHRIKTAASLGITRRSLTDRIHRFNIDVPKERKVKPTFDAKLNERYK